MAPARDSMPNATLSGLKVLEIAQVIAGPMAGTFLADLGADV
ncbi:MAG: CoA-transferase family, partial [Mycobacterium sp.]|nr:CoA-transferase family [Mycobacterium sp.]